ncbi:uncharacterized protein LOC117317109 [Pecten maximus]|uniref:uncharacterized protein LOC117317109 n=1 Tax=Pecten maximus TaxID=6579 RepID=UPI00145835C2|nr:uncharacterized protein LOC117317109 [Pecten maximus]
MDTVELAKIVDIGKSLGYEGADLQTFVDRKEQEKRKRDERALEREERGDVREAKLKLETLQLELEIEKMRKDESDRDRNDRVSNVKGKFPKLPAFDDNKDNIDAYLQRFERFAGAVKLDRQDWAVHLGALLKGRSLEVYHRLSDEDSVKYSKLKEALLKKFQMSEEGFRLKFRTCKPETGETSEQFVVRLENYLDRWVDMSQTEHTYESLTDLLVQEQFIQASRQPLALFIKERKPGDSAAMAKLADQYLEAHNGVDLKSFGKSGSYKTTPRDRDRNRSESAVSVSDMPEEVYRKELQKSQQRHKHHFDKRARNRRFKEKDKVLILLPTDNNKLLMHWKGPFEVKREVGQNNYEVEVRGKVKTYHANLLKKYLTREREVGSQPGVMSMVAAAVIEDTEEEGDLVVNDNVEIRVPELKAKETISDVRISKELGVDQLSDVLSILRDHTEVLTDLPGHCKIGEHSITLTTEEPLRCKPYPVPHALKETVKKEVKSMLEMGVIRPSKSPYASPVVLVKKPDNTTRFCIDFRRLNAVTVFDAEPMPDPEEIFSKISRSKFFTKIDLSKRYWQINMKSECREYTAFQTADGLFEFVVMPFGLVNAGATFNRTMRILLNGMENIVFWTTF